MAEYTADDMLKLISEQYGDAAASVVGKVNAWLARGDGIAVYQNEDLGHPHVGQCKLISFGSPAAQLETDMPPVQLPDMTGQINYRYQLAGTYRGALLQLTSEHIAMLPTAYREAHAYAENLNSHGFTAKVWRYETGKSNHPPTSRQFTVARGFAVSYASQLTRDDNSKAEYPIDGLQVFCAVPGQTPDDDDSITVSALVSAGRAIVAYGMQAYEVMYVASYNPRENDGQRNQEINPGIMGTVNLKQMGPGDVVPDGPKRFYDLHLTEIDA